MQSLIYRRSAAVIAVCALFASLNVSAFAQSSSGIATGSWKMTFSGAPMTPGTMVLHQEGETVIGTFGPTGTLNGKIKPGTQQMDANWAGPRGNGWATIIFSSDGKGLQGQWGMPGKKPSGTFIGTRIYPTFPPVSGIWRVSQTGGVAFISGVVKLQQQGRTVVGSYANAGQISGTFPEGSSELDGTWKDARGTGWVKWLFAADSKSMQGTWGMTGQDQPKGRMIGHLSNFVSANMRGLWYIETSGKAFAKGSIKFSQEGETVLGTYSPGGHISGTLRQGSQNLFGRWRDGRGTGPFVLKISANGKSFEGYWGTSGKSNVGRIIGKRAIASSSALQGM